MMGLREIQQENDALVARAEARRKQSLRRLKQRLQRMLYDPLKPSRFLRRDINAAIDAWDKAERRKGPR